MEQLFWRPLSEISLIDLMSAPKDPRQAEAWQRQAGRKAERKVNAVMLRGRVRVCVCAR